MERTIRNLMKQKEKVYIILHTKAIRYRFMSDAEPEGITYGDGGKPTKREAGGVMILRDDGIIAFLGTWMSRVYFHYRKESLHAVDYEQYLFPERTNG